METTLLLRGLAIGFSIAAPVGPIGVLCIRRTLAEGRASGLASGLGAATADALYGCIAGFGLTFLSALLLEQADGLRLAGGGFLCYLGFRTLRARPAADGAPARRGGLIGSFASTLLLTLTNPLTILSFAAIFAGLGLGAGEGYASATTLVVGVFTGSALWWLTLVGAIARLRARVGLRALTWINRGSGVVVLAFGIAALVPLLATVSRS